MIDDQKIHEVNIGRVAKCVQSIGLFALFQVGQFNLIATQWFILCVNDDQFWKIQCKLEAKQINEWLIKNKDGLQVTHGSTPEQTLELYCDLVYEENSSQLKRTQITLGNQIELFTNDLEYIGIPSKYLDMIEYSPTVKRAEARESVIVDDVHVFTPVRKENTESKYLKSITG